VTEVGRRLRDVRERMTEACARARRAPESVRLVAVSKTVSAATVAEAIAAGHTFFGENRVQEALPKILETGPASWHLVGHLQKNKARHAVGKFELIHGLDDADLAAEVNRRAQALSIAQPVLVQVNLAKEATKRGAPEDELLPLLGVIEDLPHLDLRGLMVVPPLAADPELSRVWFRRLRELRDRAASHLGRLLPELSMGMTDDFEVAIEEGSTLVRVGRAIFGERG
jgi:pyridoxal phosphate enzyme (YggS family)